MNRTLLIGILLFIGVAVGIFLTWPNYQTFQQLRSELKGRQQELENRETYFADLIKVKASLAEFAEGLLKVEAALPLGPQLPSLYDFLQRSSALSGMSLRNISAAVESQAQSLELRTIPVTLELVGSWSALKELTGRLNIASRMVSLQSLNLSGSQETERFNVTLQLHTYFY
ncbi:type 4a pilus biogenesis protein PilO [Patescibacteria group bacterium]|nr:type 4a pilus biogenesis protein PilO [Patescibacteria group bacterium]